MTPRHEAPTVRVVASLPSTRAFAEAIAVDSGLTLASMETMAEFQLFADDARWTLVRADGARLRLDFTAGEPGRDARYGPRADRPLLRAIAAGRFRKRHGREPCLLDATAGLGDDGWLCACAGLECVWLERSPLMHHLLCQALDHARGVATTSAVAARVTLHHAEATAWLGASPAIPADVVYLDPMFPATRRSARVGKGLQFLQALLGPDDPPVVLLQRAIGHARSHVIVKRPRTAAPLPPPPGCTHRTLDSPSLRFDIYRHRTV